MIPKEGNRKLSK